MHMDFQANPYHYLLMSHIQTLQEKSAYNLTQGLLNVMPHTNAAASVHANSVYGLWNRE